MAKTTLLDGFQLYLQDNPLPTRSRQVASAATARSYLQDIRIFLRWWEQSFGAPLTVAQLRSDQFVLNRQALQDFFAWLTGNQRRSPATVRRYSASLSAFCAFLRERQIIAHDPTRGLRVPIPKRQEPRGLTDAQRARFEAVFEAPWHRRSTKRLRNAESATAPMRLARNRAIAFLMLYAGPRVEEVHLLDLADIQINQRSGVMHIRKGKGDREREVPLPKIARQALSAWLKQRDVLSPNYDALFVDLRPPNRRLSVRSIQEMILEAGQRAGLDRLEPKVTVTPHLLRHTYAYMLRQRGVSVEVRALLCGHSVHTAMRYGSPRADEIARAVTLLDVAG